MRLHEYLDTIAIALPLSLAPLLDDIGDGQVLMLERVSKMAIDRCRATYPATTVLAIEWTFAFTAAEVEAWPLPHDCDECRDAKTRSYTVLDHGKEFIALGRMFCAEPLS